MKGAVKTNVFSALFVIVACLLISGCVKQSDIKTMEAQDLALEGVTVRQAVKAQAPPPPPEPTPVPTPEAKPEVKAVYVPEPQPEPEPTPEPREFHNIIASRRGYLALQESEDSPVKSGLTSYILLPRRQISKTSADFKRYAALHAAFRQVPQNEKFTVKEKARKEPVTSVFFWPLKQKAFAENAYEIFLKPDSFFVSNYDYGEASKILKSIQGIGGLKGPFIAAGKWGGKKSSGKESDIIIIDLGRVDSRDFENVVFAYVKRVQNQAGCWDEKFHLDYIERTLNSSVESDGRPSLWTGKWAWSMYNLLKP